MISVTVIVKNGQKRLEEVLQALSSFGEIILLDTGSTDDSLEIAKKFSNVKVYQQPFIGFGPTHNEASKLAANDWILSIDADEVASKELVEEIFALPLDPHCVYALSRHNYFRGKFIKGCGWYPDTPYRLYNKKRTRFTEALVHESIITQNLTTKTLKSPLYHYPYNTINDFLTKMQSYSTLFAEQNQGKKKSSLSRALGHSLFAFLKSYLVKRGFLIGKEGFIISLYNAHTAYYKYLKLAELNATYCRKYDNKI